MSHRAEQIIDAIANAIGSFSGYTGEVYKHRAQSLAHEQAELPATSVDFGEDSSVEDDGASNLSFLDSLLTVETTIFVSEAEESDARTKLLDMRRSIHRALMADRSLGLVFVIDTRYGGADAPEINAETESMIGRLACRWAVHYRMNITDPGDDL